MPILIKMRYTNFIKPTYFKCIILQFWRIIYINYILFLLPQEAKSNIHLFLSYLVVRWPFRGKWHRLSVTILGMHKHSSFLKNLTVGCHFIRTLYILVLRNALRRKECEGWSWESQPHLCSSTLVCEQSALVLNLSFKHRNNDIYWKEPCFCYCSNQSKKSYILEQESFKKKVTVHLWHFCYFSLIE